MPSRTRSARARTRVRPITVAVLGVALLGSTASAAQQQQFRSSVELVQLQVRVTDRAGEFVPGLDAADFALRVNGRARPIATVYEVRVDEPARDGGDPPPAAWRQWLLFFDAVFNTPRGVYAAQDAARTFVTDLILPSDLVGVVTFDLVRGAHVVVPPTRDRRQVLAAIAGLGLDSATRTTDRAGFLATSVVNSLAGLEVGVAPNMPVGREGPPIPHVDPDTVRDLLAEMSMQVGAMEMDRYTGEVARFTQQLGGMGEVLRIFRGRKHVVFFSQGFTDTVLTGSSLGDLTATTEEIQEDVGLALATSSGEERFGSAEVRDSLDDAVRRLRASDSVIHVIDPTGVGGGRDLAGIRSIDSQQGDFVSRGGSRSALTSLAGGTGGQMHWDTNDLAGAMATIERANRAYYVIAFAREEGDDATLDLEVAVGRPDARVEAPETLAIAPEFPEMSPFERQLQLAEFASKGISADDLTFAVATAAFSGDGAVVRLPVVVEVPWQQLVELADTGGDDRVELEVYSYALDAHDRMVDLASGEVALNVGAMRESPAAGLPFRYYDLLWAGPGEGRVRVILRDKELGRISSRTSAPRTIPDFASGALVLAGPFGVDWDHPGLIARGFDHASPPVHKQGGPNGYPFTVGNEEVTPSARLAGPAGAVHHVYFVAHHLATDPYGNSQPTVSLTLRSATGQEHALRAQDVVAQMYEAAIDGTHMLIRAILPLRLPAGEYGLSIAVEDSLAGQRIEETVPVTVTDG